VRNLFRAATELEAKAVVMIDADLTSFRPKWIQLLAEPLLDGYDYVAPIYERHKYDASITNHFACPLLRTLYGVRIRQPIGGDFGFSGRLAQSYLSERLWNEAIANFGIDIWMTTIAVVRGFKVCQTFLGSAKSHTVKDPAWHLRQMFKDVIATIFELMADFDHYWLHVTEHKASLIFGYGLGVSDTPPTPGIDKDNLYQTFADGFDQYEEMWREVLAPAQFEELADNRTQSLDSFYYSSDLWVKIIYDFAAAYRYRPDMKDAIVESMVPLYYSRMLSYVNSTIELGTAACEDYLENIYRRFEKQKPYLTDQWNLEKRKTADALFKLQ
jgi:hypothetical protein